MLPRQVERGDGGVVTNGRLLEFGRVHACAGYYPKRHVLVSRQGELGDLWKKLEKALATANEGEARGCHRWMETHSDDSSACANVHACRAVLDGDEGCGPGRRAKLKHDRDDIGGPDLCRRQRGSLAREPILAKPRVLISGGSRSAFLLFIRAFPEHVSRLMDEASLIAYHGSSVRA